MSLQWFVTNRWPPRYVICGRFLRRFLAPIFEVWKNHNSMKNICLGPIWFLLTWHSSSHELINYWSNAKVLIQTARPAKLPIHEMLEIGSHPNTINLKTDTIGLSRSCIWPIVNQFKRNRMSSQQKSDLILLRDCWEILNFFLSNFCDKCEVSFPSN